MAKVRRFVSPEQSAYAQWLAIGMRIAMVGLIAAFVAYVIGYPAAHVPLETLPRYWGLPAARYLATVGARPGWGWLEFVGSGDYLNIAGIAFLASITITGCLRILPVVLKQGDRICAAIVLAQVVVLALAASGLLVAGHG